MIFLGVDPGLTGALAWVQVTKERPRPRLLDVADTPVMQEIVKGKTRSRIDLRGLHGLFRARSTMPADVALIEEVGARPGEAARAVFRFGFTSGAMAAAAASVSSRVEFVTPGVWKRKLGLTADKNLSRALAAQYFPDHADTFKRVRDDGRAEAALIAFYAALHFSS